MLETMNKPCRCPCSSSPWTLQQHNLLVLFALNKQAYLPLSPNTDMFDTCSNVPQSHNLRDSWTSPAFFLHSFNYSLNHLFSELIHALSLPPPLFPRTLMRKTPLVLPGLF